MNRRKFLVAGTCASAALLTGAKGQAEVSIEIDNTLLGTPAGVTISPQVYGQFLEHLGGVIYDGVWVGTGSKIANVGGIRKSFVDDMKRIAVPNFRWPGGCFADSYHWRDGVGSAAGRPRRYNYWQASTPAGVDATESNQFGLHEFMRLCRLTGAEPYLAANMGSGAPQEFHDWVSYCNAARGTVTLADERVKNGQAEPFGIRYWGVGNESWGCGGDMSPEEYAMLYRRFATQFPAYPPAPFLVAVGPRGHSKDLDLDWTRRFFEGMKGHKTPVHGLSVHFYTDFRQRPEKAATFDVQGWYDVLREGMRVEAVITQHWELMQRYEEARKTKLVLDEWGVWYKPGEEIAPRYVLSQPITLRDAVHTALTFNAFQRHADKLEMANVAQTVNCIHSLFLAEGIRYTRTPVYDVFDMYKGHMGATVLPLRVQAAALNGTGAGAPLPRISGSASIKGRAVTVTLANVSPEDGANVAIAVKAGSITEGRGSVLTHAEMTGANTLDRPDEVRQAPLRVEMRGSRVVVQVPKHSVVALELRLA